MCFKISVFLCKMLDLCTLDGSHMEYTENEPLFTNRTTFASKTKATNTFLVRNNFLNNVYQKKKRLFENLHVVEPEHDV